MTRYKPECVQPEVVWRSLKVKGSRGWSNTSSTADRGNVEDVSETPATLKGEISVTMLRS